MLEHALKLLASVAVMVDDFLKILYLSWTFANFWTLLKSGRVGELFVFSKLIKNLDDYSARMCV